MNILYNNRTGCYKIVKKNNKFKLYFINTHSNIYGTLYILDKDQQLPSQFNTNTDLVYHKKYNSSLYNNTKNIYEGTNVIPVGNNYIPLSTKTFPIQVGLNNTKNWITLSPSTTDEITKNFSIITSTGYADYAQNKLKITVDNNTIPWNYIKDGCFNRANIANGLILYNNPLMYKKVGRIFISMPLFQLGAWSYIFYNDFGGTRPRQTTGTSCVLENTTLNSNLNTEILNNNFTTKCDNNSYIKTRTGWYWHTALIMLNNDTDMSKAKIDEYMVLDPAINIDNPTPLNDWIFAITGFRDLNSLNQNGCLINITTPQSPEIGYPSTPEDPYLMTLEAQETLIKDYLTNQGLSSYTMSYDNYVAFYNFIQQQYPSLLSNYQTPNNFFKKKV